jgi:hypothetical protein
MGLSFVPIGESILTKSLTIISVKMRLFKEKSLFFEYVQKAQERLAILLEIGTAGIGQHVPLSLPKGDAQKVTLRFLYEETGLILGWKKLIISYLYQGGEKWPYTSFNTASV